MNYIFKKKPYVYLFSAIDFLGGILFLPFSIFKRKAPGNVGKILLIRLDHIGDVVYSTAIPQNLKEHYRGAKITFLVPSAAKDIVMNNPYVDEVICYDAPWFSRNEKKEFELSSFLMLSEGLKRQGYDLGFDLRGDFRHILLMAMAGIKFRVGYGITGGGFLLHRMVDYREGVHSLEHNLDLLRGMGVKIINFSLQLYSSEKDESRINDLLKESGLTGEDFIVTVHPYAGYSSKNWLDDRFAELINILKENYKAKIILVGSENDRAKTDELIRISRSTAINAAGRISLVGLYTLLKRSKLFIGLDSGPSHIAASTGKPSVILFSGTNSIQQWGAKGGNAVIIQKEIPCKGCEKLDCEHNICMDLISVEDVVDAVKKVLSS